LFFEQRIKFNTLPSSIVLLFGVAMVGFMLNASAGKIDVSSIAIAGDTCSKYGGVVTFEQQGSKSSLSVCQLGGTGTFWPENYTSIHDRGSALFSKKKAFDILGFQSWL